MDNFIGPGTHTYVQRSKHGRKQAMSGLGWHHMTIRDKGQILGGLEQGRSLGGPYHVELHPTNRCNINCFFCATRRIRQEDELPLGTLARRFLPPAAAPDAPRRGGGGSLAVFPVYAAAHSIQPLLDYPYL